MARYITEIVEGMDLFVPDAYDAFTLVPGGMPNGDDSLGVANAPFLAWAVPVATTPNVFTDFSSIFGLTFWVKRASIGAVSTRYILRSVSSPSLGGQWSVASNGNNSFGGARGSSANVSITSGSWHLVVFNFGSGPRRGGFTNSTEGTIGSGPSDSAAPGANPYVFSLGDYLAPASIGTAFEIGKIAFHDHHISYTEQMLLYNAMML